MNIKILFVLALVVVVGVGGFFVYDRVINDGNADTGFSEFEQEEIDPVDEEQLQKDREEFSKQRDSQKEEAANDVTTPSSLKDIEDENIRGEVGLELAGEAAGAGDLNLANEYLDVLMSDPSKGYALDAARVCYELNSDEARKKECEQNANDAAKAQGYLEDGESLPENYFNKPEEIG